LNLSGSGVSLSAGVRGARINFGPRGVYGSVGRFPEPASIPASSPDYP
jgi:hypothetical protein